MRSCPAFSHLISSTTLVVLLLLRGHLLRRIRVPVLLLRRREALRRATVALLGRVSPTVGHRRIHVRSGHLVARSGVAHSIGSRSSEASPSIATTSSTETAAASGTIVRCLINSNGSSVKLDVVHACDSVLGIALLGVSYKSKAAAATSIAVLDHHSFFNRAKLLELLAQSGLLSMPC